MEDIGLGDPITPELAGIGRVANFQHPPLDVGPVILQEIFNVIPVNGVAAIEAKISADGS